MTEQRQPTDYGSGLPPAFKSPDAQEPETRVRRRQHPFAGWGTAVVGGVIAAVLGTNLHGQLAYAGDQAYPLGAVLALVFAFAVMVWVGMRADNVLATGLAGMVTYLLVGIMATSLFGDPLIVTETTAEMQLGIELAGKIWMIGLAVAVVLAIVAAAWALKPRR